MQDPLDIINDIFLEYDLSCRVVALEIDCHHIKRAQRRMISHQLKHDLSPDYEITYTPNRYRVTLRPSNRAAA